MGEARHKPSLIELQAFASDAIRIVNDHHPLTVLSNKLNDHMPLTLACFLSQHLAPITPVSGFHKTGDLRKDFFCNTFQDEKLFPYASGPRTVENSL